MAGATSDTSIALKDHPRFLVTMRALLLVLGLSALAVAAGSAAPTVDYARQVKPLFAARCYACHGGLKQEAGLRLDTGALVRKGGPRGPILTPGKAAGSRLMARLTAAKPPLRMPPEGEPLSPQEIALIRGWIEQGAKSPPGEKAEEDPRRHWAFLRPQRPPLPKVKNAAWVRNPIDAFVLAEQEKRGLRPAPPASRETLLRRVTLDLTGLPPTREELHAFLADRSPDAYEKVVDRLLASPRYGERWGRHWMDVWRYSDWYGRRLQDDVRNSYGQVWRWRDWIITSLNSDKPYDRMVREMLAADEIAPEDEEALAATGFLVRNWYSLNYNQWMRDNVEHTGKAFLGLTLNCAHCHDHKYDPLSQEEYFRFRAFFEPLELRHDRWPGDADPGPFKKYVYGGTTAALKSGMIRVFDEKPEAKTYLYQRGDERTRFPGEPTVEPGVPAVLGGALRITPVTLPAPAHYPGLKRFIREEEIARREKAVADARAASPPDALKIVAAESELTALHARIRADDARFGMASNAEELALAASTAERTAKLRAAEAALSVAERALTEARARAAAAPADAALKEALGKAEASATAARTAADTARKAAEAPATAAYTPLTPLYPERSTGRRRALAEWIASRDNPLTARVAVNHVWMRHFGRPLVETVFDFGRNGKRPTHPELLDWLSATFAAVQSPEFKVLTRPSVKTGDSGPRTQDPGLSPGLGWSFKKLHRLLVTSNTYRQAAVPAASAGTKLLVGYAARRAEAEVVRDSILFASGVLDTTLGGPELDNRQETTRRRSLYYSVYAEDGGSMQFLATFDAPNTCDAYRRTESIMPQQALAMANSRLTLDGGRLLARKLWESLPSGGTRDPAFVTAAFEALLTRRPTAEELRACEEYLRQQEALFRESGPPPAGGGVAPAAEPALRAGESLVQALFNHNEFLMIR